MYEGHVDPGVPIWMLTSAGNICHVRIGQQQGLFSKPDITSDASFHLIRFHLILFLPNDPL